MAQDSPPNNEDSTGNNEKKSSPSSLADADELQFITGVLARYGIPEYLKHLVIIESHLDREATSDAGARGPWQFMPAEAQHYGLKLQPVDERTDLYKSTFAAARLLSDLYNRYHNWLMVVAAYNGGSGRMDKALLLAGTRDIDAVMKHMPGETQEHVRRFIAAARPVADTVTTTITVFRTAIQQPDFDVPVHNGSYRTVQITAGFKKQVLIKGLNMDPVLFEQLNPCIEEDFAARGESRLTLPPDKMPLFLASKEHLLDESLMLTP